MLYTDAEIHAVFSCSQQAVDLVSCNSSLRCCQYRTNCCRYQM